MGQAHDISNSLEKVLLEQASQYTEPTTVMLLGRNLASASLSISSTSAASNTAAGAIIAMGLLLAIAAMGSASWE